MKEKHVITREERNDVFAYSERLNELPNADLIEEALRTTGFNKEKVLITVLAKRLEVLTSAYSLEAA